MFYILFFIAGLVAGCGSSDDMATGTPVPQNPTPQNPQPQNPTETTTVRYLALGDSYTIGQSVCATCRFPEQLKSQIQVQRPETTVDLKLIATTGWTTSNLLQAIQDQDPSSDQDLVTLLIGVNNQYQHQSFSIYETEFVALVNKAIVLAKGDKDKVIVVSIPDYAYTPFGQNLPNPENVSLELAQYNTFAQNYCTSAGITFVNITDITQMGLQYPNLVASDGLHPSEQAYTQFMQRILPLALEKLPQ